MNLETDNPEKGLLLQRSAHHRGLLEEEMKAITEKSEKIITNALIIGGALALTYFLVTSFTGSERKSKSKKVKRATVAEQDDVVESPEQPETPGVLSQIGGVVAAQVAGLLLSIAREKLVEFLQSQTAKKDNDHERS